MRRTYCSNLGAESPTDVAFSPSESGDDTRPIHDATFLIVLSLKDHLEATPGRHCPVGMVCQPTKAGCLGALFSSTNRQDNFGSQLAVLLAEVIQVQRQTLAKISLGAMLMMASKEGLMSQTNQQEQV